MRPFSKLPRRMPGLSSSSQLHFSNSDGISGAVLTRAITENGPWLSFSVYRATTSLISPKGCAALKTSGKAAPKCGDDKTASAFRGGEESHFFMLWIFPAALYIVKQTEQQDNLCENLIPGTETPAAVVPADWRGAICRRPPPKIMRNPCIHFGAFPPSVFSDSEHEQIQFFMRSFA